MTRAWLKMPGLVVCDGCGEGIHVSGMLVICVSNERGVLCVRCKSNFIFGLATFVDGACMTGASGDVTMKSVGISG